MATVLEPAKRPSKDELEEVRHLVELMIDWVGDVPFYKVGKGKLEQVPDHMVGRLRRFRRSLKRKDEG